MAGATFLARTYRPPLRSFFQTVVTLVAAAPAFSPRGEIGLETSSKEIRSSDKKGSRVSLKFRFELSGKRAKSVVIKIVVVTDVKRGSRIRVITEEQLPGGSRRQRVVINARADKREARELISRAQGENVCVERRQSGVVARQTRFCVIE